MKHSPISRAALHGHIVAVPSYRHTIDMTALSLQLRVRRRRRVRWAIVLAALAFLIVFGGRL